MLKLIFSSKPKIIYIFQKKNHFLKYASVLALCKKTTHFFIKIFFLKICIFIYFYLLFLKYIYRGGLGCHSLWGWAASPPGAGLQPAWVLGFKRTGLKPIPFIFRVGLCARLDPVTVSTVTDLRKNEEEDAQ